MTNKGGARRHGWQQTHIETPTSAQHKKNNKAKAAEKRAALREQHGLAC